MANMSRVRRSSLPPVAKKWYEKIHYQWLGGFEFMSEDDKRKALEDMEQDEEERRRANLMMAEWSFTQMQPWIFGLDTEPTSVGMFFDLGREGRAAAVRKILRAFWTEDEIRPLPQPRWLYLDNGRIRGVDQKPVE